MLLGFWRTTFKSVCVNEIPLNSVWAENDSDGYIHASTNVP